ncbi:MAG: hypothetical protein COA50_07835 [Flavobacteriaceae bacterium]|nr:MAG: hypothetical protein COA50_07835 [Flavobacteriaceae bacterium]
MKIKCPIASKIGKLTTISLLDMELVALMKRTDTKFVVNKSQLLPILERITCDYKVLEIDGNSIMSYSSLYFDTTNHKFYHDHHNGKSNRTKIRIRKYIDSELCFLEIKQKNGRGETNKSRIPIGDFETNLSKPSHDFITKTTLQSHELTPTLWNNFERITLVNLKDKERVTIDFNLFYTMNGHEKSYENLVVIEVKQERFNRNSPIVRTLKMLKHYPYSFSKYCIGMISLYSDLKYNVFKNKLIKINKITT